MTAAALPFQDVVRAAIAEWLAGDAARVVVTEDARAPWPAGQRVVAPVADRGALGLALGLSLAGRPAIVEVSGTGRLPALVELLAEAGAVAAAGGFPVPLLLRVPWGIEAQGLDQPVGRWLLDLPGVEVVAASSGAHAAALLRDWAGRPRPLVLLEARVLQRDRRAGHTAAGPAVLRRGPAAVVAAAGPHVAVALAAAEALAAEGVAVTVLDLVRLAPFPAAELAAQVREAGRLVFVGDDASLARRAREAALDGAFEYLESPLASAAPDATAAAAAVREALAW